MRQGLRTPPVFPHLPEGRKDQHLPTPVTCLLLTVRKTLFRDREVNVKKKKKKLNVFKVISQGGRRVTIQNRDHFFIINLVERRRKKKIFKDDNKNLC